MRLIHLYLIAYFMLVIGAALALFKAGVLSRLHPLWVVIGGSLVVGLGILLAITSDKRVTRD